jgi:hypothetical protein
VDEQCDKEEGDVGEVVVVVVAGCGRRGRLVVETEGSLSAQRSKDDDGDAQSRSEDRMGRSG